MKTSKYSSVLIIFVTIGLICVAWFGIGSAIKSVREMRYGIDIRGGVEAVFEPQEIDQKPSSEEMSAARQVIESRLDNENITDREVTVDPDGGYLIVRFPWKSDEKDFDPEKAISELGEMAELTFRAPNGEVLLSGKDLKSASPETQKENGAPQYVVKLVFDNEGADKFAEATERLIGQHISIYMDEDLISSPVVQTAITAGEAVITGQDSFQEAKTLADKINAGALPFALETKTFSTISPSLGQSALGIMIYSGLIAFAGVCIFMLIMYGLPGAVACVTLTLQMTLQLLAISVPQYTLTLQGIAGIILSLGMAVDLNIIIAERISEELAKGATIKQAVQNGYKRAFTSVLDGNITTAIVAIVMMIFGSGSMLSFGYTLLTGMVINCFIGVNASKTLILSLLNFKVCNKTALFKEKKTRRPINFYKNKKCFAFLSGIVICIGIVALFTKGVSLDTQFAGGTVLKYRMTAQELSNGLNTDTLSQKIESATDRPVTTQVTDSNINSEKNISVTLAGNGGLTPELQETINKTVGKELGVPDLNVSESYSVEPYIGAKALRNAVIAVIISFICITLYVWIRFSALSGLSAGIMALIALMHDVCVVFFTFVLFGISLGDAFVAVILTIIGYSINDTIVVYDRIRENTTMEHYNDITSLINISITQVMSRSINTSITTALCVVVLLLASVAFGITSIYQFSLPMLIGLISGCYSSVCIASVLWAMWKLKKNK